MLTQDQKLARQGKAGSSDAAAILGLDPFRSAADVYLEKIGQVDSFAGNENTDRGELLEPVLLRWASRQLDKPIVESISFHHPSGLLVANLDAVVQPTDPLGDPVEAIEAKSTVMGEEYGEEGTDQVPDRVLAQTAHQFVCVPTLRVIWVPVLLPGYRRFDWRMYRVERNPDLCAAVEAADLDFMQNHVVPRIPPSDFRPSLEVLKRVRRVPNKTVPVAAELVDRWLVAKKASSDAEKELEKAQSYLLAALGDAEGGYIDGGIVTYMETHRRAYEVKETTYRSLRFKVNRKEQSHDTRNT